jgi:thiamine-monophosphate kinase
VVSTDVLVEGVHFRLDWSSAADVGRRVAAQNLADAAAMGARPTALVVALAAPRERLTGRWLRDFARGLGQFCAAWGTGLVGGDLALGPAVVACGTVLGDLGGRPAVRRGGARPGDVVGLHDAVRHGSARPPGLGLGASGAGLACLAAGGLERALEAWPGPAPAGIRALADNAVAAYRAPQPPISAGVEAAEAGASAMIDISDGLLRDAGRIAAASGVRLCLDAQSAALAGAARAFRPLAEVLGRDPWQWVLGGGEDHALLATFPAAAALPTGWDVIGQVEGLGDESGGEAAAPDAMVVGLPKTALGGAAAGPAGGWLSAAALGGGVLGWDHLA